MRRFTATHWRCPSSATRRPPLGSPSPTQRKPVSLSSTSYFFQLVQAYGLPYLHAYVGHTSTLDLCFSQSRKHFIFEISDTICAIVVRAYAHGAMSCWIDPTWWTH